MEQVVVYKKDGSKIHLNKYDSGSGVVRAEQVCELLGQDVINISVKSASYITFDIGDFIDVFGYLYRLNAAPREMKFNDRSFEFELRFEGPQYDLIKVQYIDIDSTGFSTGTSFAIMAGLKSLADLIIRNANRVYGDHTWVLGDCPDMTEVQNFLFDNESCLQALQRLCEHYGYFYAIDRLSNGTHRLNIKEINDVLPDVFRYGWARGLYSLERRPFANRSVITRLFAFGSTRNISPSYRVGSPRLKLPLNNILSEGVPAIQNDKAIAEFGIVEGTVMFDEVYPHRVGTVTAVDSNDINVFYDFQMPFDLLEKAGGNDKYLLTGIEPKIKFNSGNLAGYEFTISAYDKVNNRFKIITYTDQRGMQFPSKDTNAFRIRVGDQYVITDINLPDSYIEIAEKELLSKAEKYLSDNSRPWVEYDLDTDEMYVKSKAETTDFYVTGVSLLPGIAPSNVSASPADMGVVNYFKLGHYVKVIDEDLGLNGNLRITGWTRDVLRHYEYNLTLGESKVEQRKKSIRRAKLYSTPATVGVTSAPVNAGASAAANNMTANFESLGGPLLKQTQDGIDGRISALEAKISDMLPVTRYFTVPYDTMLLDIPDLQDTVVLAIERNHSLEKVNQRGRTLVFENEVYAGEILGVTYRKTIRLT